MFLPRFIKEIYRQENRNWQKDIFVFFFFRKKIGRKFFSSYRFFRENLGLCSTYFRDRWQVNLYCFPSYLRYLTLYCVIDDEDITRYNIARWEEGKKGREKRRVTTAFVHKIFRAVLFASYKSFSLTSSIMPFDSFEYSFFNVWRCEKWRQEGRVCANIIAKAYFWNYASDKNWSVPFRIPERREIRFPFRNRLRNERL